MPNLMIVESPTKAKKIADFLGSEWVVRASLGHIMEVANVGQNNVGVDFSKNDVVIHFQPRTGLKGGSGGKESIAQLKKEAEKADKIYLASDPDREGESISWHLMNEVVPEKKRGNTYRITYTEITKSAIEKAIANARQIDQDLVDAQLARQATDRVVGYEISPLVISAGVGRSAGRVQSPALRIVCNREKEIRNFKPTNYWSLVSQYGEGFKAIYNGQSGQSQVAEEAEVQDDAADVSESVGDTGARVSSQQEADSILAIAQSAPHKITSFTGNKTSKTPPPALTTSSLQQVASVKLNLSPEDTMKVAQALFEDGKISYHRTDSVSLSPEFCEEVKAWLQVHKPKLVGDKTATHKDKAGAQGAHEAIRPTHVEDTPESLQGKMKGANLAVYTLIWNRAIASQCASAQLNKSVVQIQAGATTWIARGSVLLEPGYSEILNDIGGDAQLPALTEGATLKLVKATAEAKKTSPPGRYSEAKLIQTLERFGVGRPSTYATIMGGLKAREYVKIEGKNLAPTETGLKTDEFVGKVFPQIVDMKFTAGLEKQLDEIAEGKRQWKPLMQDFYFKQLRPAVDGIGRALVAATRECSKEACPDCSKPLVVMRPKDATKLSAMGKDHYLKCMEGCPDVLMFWNQALSRWFKKGEKLPSAPAQLTQYPCKVCAKMLQLVKYQKDGKPKAMLVCSDETSKGKDDHKDEVYFLVKDGGFWNPTTDEVLGGEPSKPSGGAKSSKASGKKPGKVDTLPRLKHLSVRQKYEKA